MVVEEVQGEEVVVVGIRRVYEVRVGNWCLAMVRAGSYSRHKRKIDLESKWSALRAKCPYNCLDIWAVIIRNSWQQCQTHCNSGLPRLPWHNFYRRL